MRSHALNKYLYACIMMELETYKHVCMLVFKNVDRCSVTGMLSNMPSHASVRILSSLFAWYLCIPCMFCFFFSISVFVCPFRFIGVLAHVIESRIKGLSNMQVISIDLRLIWIHNRKSGEFHIQLEKKWYVVTFRIATKLKSLSRYEENTNSI
jgi:hypothetical protein